jgi:hypothetical protein
MLQTLEVGELNARAVVTGPVQHRSSGLFAANEAFLVSYPPHLSQIERMHCSVILLTRHSVSAFEIPKHLRHNVKATT